MSEPNYKCPQCDGRLKPLKTDAYECERCDREIREVVVEDMDAFERVAESDGPASEIAQAALEGIDQ